MQTDLQTSLDPWEIDLNKRGRWWRPLVCSVESFTLILSESPSVVLLPYNACNSFHVCLLPCCFTSPSCLRPPPYRIATHLVALSPSVAPDFALNSLLFRHDPLSSPTYQHRLIFLTGEKLGKSYTIFRRRLTLRSVLLSYLVFSSPGEYGSSFSRNVWNLPLPKHTEVGMSSIFLYNVKIVHIVIVMQFLDIKLVRLWIFRSSVSLSDLSLIKYYPLHLLIFALFHCLPIFPTITPYFFPFPLHPRLLSLPLGRERA